METFEQLVAHADEVAVLLVARGETLAVAESSAGGLISAALLAVPGASAYFMGGAVVYTRQSRRLLLGVPDEAMAGVAPTSEAQALLLARAARTQLATTWALAETGAAGPTGNRYGHPAGHACFAAVGVSEATLTLETGRDDRLGNMLAFAAAAIDLLASQLRG